MYTNVKKGEHVYRYGQQLISPLVVECEHRRQ